MLLFLVGDLDDAAVQWMTLECERRGLESLPLCTGRFPSDIVLTAQPSGALLHGTIELHERTVQLAAIRGVWHYLAGEPGPDPDLDALGQQLASRESREALRGLYRALEDRVWVNMPHAEQHARYRVFQLQQAAQAGLLTPRTLVSNDPDRVLAFVDACGGQVAYKPISHLLVPDGDADALNYVTRLRRADVEQHADVLRIAPCMFQEVVPKRRDITLYVIGQHVWAAGVATGAGAADALDYRSDGVWSHHYTPVALPAQVERACVRLTRQLGLRMCNLDLLLTPDGDYVFVDANPTDQWAELEYRTGLPLCEALVDELSHAETLADHPYLRDRSLSFEPSVYGALARPEPRPC